MHFQDNPTNTQHCCARTHEVSLGSTTPLRNPSDTARSTFDCQAELPPSTVASHRQSRDKERERERKIGTAFVRFPEHRFFSTPINMFSMLFA